MRTQLEVNHYLQDTTIKNARNLLDIELCIRNNNLHLPNNVIIHENGISFVEFYKWFENRNKIPTTYEECVRIAKNIHGYDIHIDTPAYRELMESFVKLLICRDAYWKIAGEQMGLGKPWESENPSRHYVFSIENFGGEIQKNAAVVRMLNRILVFPTKEMRDAFYENFKDLIEQCKELL
jgi:hypothetical protein